MTIHLPLLLLLAAAPAGARTTLRDLARGQKFSSMSIFRDALQDPDPAVRAEAAFGLGQLGMTEVPEGGKEDPVAAPTRAAAADALAPAVSDPDAGARRAAVEALGKVGGADSESFLLSATTDADAGVRGAAALALFRRRFLKHAPEYSPAAVARLTALAKDPDPEVRWRAAYAFTRWPEPRAADALAALQDDADARARLFAVRALGKLKTAPGAARLTDPDAYVRAEAVAAFAAAKAWDKLPDAIFSDPSAHVRAAAADAAAASGDAARFAPLLEKLMAGPGTMAPGRALLALARLNAPGAAAAVAAARRSPSWWLRSRAYEAAGLLPGADAVLAAGVEDGDARVASQALETWAASTSAAVVPVLERVLEDPKAPLETTGTAVEAASDRADPALLDGLLSAMTRAEGPGAAELREDLRKAILTTVKKAPAREEEVGKLLKKFPPFTDKPRRFRPLKAAPTVLFETERGSFTIALASAENAGVHAAAFARGVKKKLYDGLIWHRVVTAFVVQGGDPRGSGWGDAGWRLADELNPLHFERGTVGMPKAGKDTGGCQLFISLIPTPHLDGRYTVFGRVTSGMEVVDRLEPGDRILRARLE